MTDFTDHYRDKPLSKPETAFFARVLQCIQCTQPEEKSDCATRLLHDWQTNQLAWPDTSALQDYSMPGHPEKPLLVPPRELPRRSVNTLEGRAALLHSIAHIEFNAINLALDAVYRFRDMPRPFYTDWLGVAAEEAYHFTLVDRHLHALGYRYGDFAAHNGLWEMAMRTKDSALVRMAIIPRGMEARGLDATPAIMEKLKTSGDTHAMDILKIILRDEISHVEIGTRWFNYLCDSQNLSRQETFEQLMRRFINGRVKLPLHRQARISAGFTEAELDFLEGLV
jgi:uncharacterized ferritin-like protein (DUF455 family)